MNLQAGDLSSLQGRREGHSKHTPSPALSGLTREEAWVGDHTFRTQSGPAVFLPRDHIFGNEALPKNLGHKVALHQGPHSQLQVWGGT